MALVGEVVARFKAETSDYLSKIDQAKAKNQELAKTLLATAGSADKAIASLQVAKGKNALGDFGIDRRQVGGIISAIKEIDKESKTAKGNVEELAKALNQQGRRANAFGDITESFDSFTRGDFLKGIEKFKKGLADIKETEGFGGIALKAALVLTITEKIGSSLANMSGKAAAAVDQFRQGQASAGELAENLLGAIPILGNFWRFGRDIREIITGENVQLERQLKLLGEIAAAGDRAHKAAIARVQFVESAQQTTGDINEQTNIAGQKALGVTGTATFNELTLKANQDLRQFAEQTNKVFGESIAAQQAKRQAFLNAGKTAEAQAVDDLIAKLEDQRDKLVRARQKAVSDAFNQELSDKLGGKSVEQADAEAFGKKIVNGITAQLKASPITAWLKKQLEDGQKDMEALQKKAQQIKESIKTPAEKLADDLGDAILAKKSKLLSGADLDKLMTKDAKDLLKEQREITENQKRVFDLPQIKELRAGQTLYAPPSKLDEKQLERLTEIRDSLVVIKDKAKQEGITIEEINI